MLIGADTDRRWQSRRAYRAGTVRLLPPGPGWDTAHRRASRFPRHCGIVAIRGVPRRKGDNRFGLFDFADLLAERRDGRLQRRPGSRRGPGEIAFTRLSPLAVSSAAIRSRSWNSRVIFFGADDRRKRVGPRCLFDLDPVQIHRPNAVADRGRLGRQAGIQQAEEHQHEQQRSGIPDAHQQLPNRTHEPHANLLALRPSAEIETGPRNFDRRLWRKMAELLTAA